MVQLKNSEKLPKKLIGFIPESTHTGIVESVLYKGVEISLIISDAVSNIREDIGYLIENYKDTEPDCRPFLLIRDVTIGTMFTLYSPKILFDKIRGKDNFKIGNNVDCLEIDPEIISSIKKAKSGDIEIDLDDSLKNEIRQFLSDNDSMLRGGITDELKLLLNGTLNFNNLKVQMIIDYEENKDIYDSLTEILEKVSKQLELVE